MHDQRGQSQASAPGWETALGSATSGLLWPRLLRTLGMAARPERLFVAVLILLLTFVIGEVGSSADRGARQATPSAENAAISASQPAEEGQEGNTRRANFAGFVFRQITGGLDGIASGMFSLRVEQVKTEVRLLATHFPATTWNRYGMWGIALAVPILLVWAIGGCALCRMTACDVALGELVGVKRSLGFALSRVGSILVAVLGPLAFVLAIGAIVAVIGWAMYSASWSRGTGSVLFAVPLVLSALAVIMLFCYVVAAPLLVPAVACEGSDGLDAIQRAFAYVLGQPFRLVAYVIVMLLISYPTLVILKQASEASVHFAAWCSGLMAGDSGRAFLGEGMRPVKLGHWQLAAGGVVGAYATSLLFTGSTMMYLLLRQVHDGQDLTEVWVPGLIEGTMAQSLRARAEAGSAESSGRLGAEPGGPTSAEDEQ